MGLIKALGGAVSGTLADQWKEFFYCDSIDNNTLVVKGQKRVNARRSSNTKGSENVISNGSLIAVADGQCMIIVEQGKVVELCAEPGEYKYDTSTEPSVFCGSLGERITAIFKTAGRRFGFGGDTAKDQRVYYFNIKEILDNKFGTPQPVPFRVVDSNIGLDIDVAVRCAGLFSYKIADPITFYANVCGNVTEDYTKFLLESQLKSEFISALQPAFGKLSEKEMRPNQIVAHTTDLENAMNDALKEKWFEKRGLEVVSIALNSVTLPEEDQKLIKELQRKAVMRDPGMAGATLVEGQAEAMKAAAGNSAGAMTGFMGLGMAMNQMGGQNGMNAGAFYNMQSQQQAQKAEQEKAANTWTCPKCGAKATGKFCPECGTKKPEPEQEGAWTCPKCGAKATGKFCPECGTKKPEAEAGWTCPTCGKVNKGKFCMECGTKKPANEPLYKCDKCGWEPKDPKNPPKFCPVCGDPFTDDDIAK